MIIRILRLGALTLHVLFGLMMLALLFPPLAEPRRAALRVGWSVWLVRLLGIRLQLMGTAPALRGMLFAANHVSWLDPFLLMARHPAHFVAKAEIRSWPVLGWLAAQSGTLFIERERRRDVGRISALFTELLQAGDNVALFPESTTGDGSALNPFKPALLQAVCSSNSLLCPVAIRYVDQAGHPHMAPVWVGDMNFAESILRITAARGIIAELTFCPCIAGAHQNRRILALKAQTAIANALSLPVRYTQPETPAYPPDAEL